jgi:hypothetical protein
VNNLGSVKRQISKRRFLIYQATHGFGVELFLLGTAFSIAATLGRTLIIPLMPDLETTNYRRGLDHYFALNTVSPWISTPDFLRRFGPTIGTTFQVIPKYRNEYKSGTIRALHPVWTDCIESLTGFKRMGFELHRIIPVGVSRCIPLSNIPNVFASTDPVIAISFINGITDEPTMVDRPPIGISIPNIPTAIREPYISMALSFLKTDAVAALHWRRRHHIKTMASLLGNGRLPTAKEMVNHVPSTAHELLVASDTRVDALRRVARGRLVRQYRNHDPQVNAVVDMALCANSKWFVGTYASTFSFYVAYLRSARGAHPETTILL